MKYKKHETILEIEWEDHQGWTGWRSKEEIEDITNRSKGILIANTYGTYCGENKFSIFICQTMTKESGNNIMQILKRDINKIRILK
jgi:hypothetical protein